MLLGDLIRTFEVLPQDHLVTHYRGGPPVGLLISWRGDYSQLSLPPGEMAVTVEEVLDDARHALREPLVGYKGGLYTMTENSTVYADAYGMSHGTILAGIIIPAPSVVELVLRRPVS